MSESWEKDGETIVVNGELNLSSDPHVNFQASMDKLNLTLELQKNGWVKSEAL